MRILKQGGLFRLFLNSKRIKYHQFEAAYVSFTKRFDSLGLEVEFPSDWHEEPRAWLRIKLGFVRIALSIPWKKVVPDEGQCSGPTYGIVYLHEAASICIHYGKSKGTKDDPIKFIYMPWDWGSAVQRTVLSDKQGPYQYVYVLKSGEVQYRKAMTHLVYMRWERPWFPRKLEKYFIDVEFDDEVGERTGSWKGGVLACSYELKKEMNETQEQALKRMEMERRF